VIYDGWVVEVRDGNTVERSSQVGPGKPIAPTHSFNSVNQLTPTAPPPASAARTATLANTNPHRYASGYLDTATGLYQFGQRYYQPTLGRWTQQDSLSHIGDLNQADRYTYTGDDPVNNIDPSGMCDGFFGCAEAAAHAVGNAISSPEGCSFLALGVGLAAGVAGIAFISATAGASVLVTYTVATGVFTAGVETACNA